MFHKLFRKASEASGVLRDDLATDSGMLCVWDAQPFFSVTDYDAWEKELCEDVDILRHIEAGHLVPLNLGDGAFSVEVRFESPESMNDRERKYLLVSSQPYRLHSTGRVLVSGLEHVGADPRAFIEVTLPAGDYMAQIQLIDWTEEPGSRDDQGRPASHALPDMIVFLQLAEGTSPIYRSDLETFRREDALR